MHVRGFTRDPGSGVATSKRGSYARLIEKIPYLQELGITAVELPTGLSVRCSGQPAGENQLLGLCANLLLRATPSVQFASGSSRTGGRISRHGQSAALRWDRGHSGCGVQPYGRRERGRADTVFPGLGQQCLLYPRTRPLALCQLFRDGNTFNVNHPVVRRLIVDSLRYWVQEMHVDGFRFDLASILTRDESGHVIPNPPVLWDIESDPSLAGIKLIAEAWDAAGLYQVGSFLGDSWKEWNGRSRDDARSFFRSEDGSLSRFADRFVGSPDIYDRKQREPEQSVNFVTCHDGFTLNDLVSYSEKHNEANDEGNRDGADDTAIPLDIVPWRSAAPISGNVYRAHPRSVIVLLADLK